MHRVGTNLARPHREGQVIDERRDRPFGPRVTQAPESGGRIVDRAAQHRGQAAGGNDRTAVVQVGQCGLDRVHYADEVHLDGVEESLRILAAQRADSRIGDHSVQLAQLDDACLDSDSDGIAVTDLACRTKMLRPVFSTSRTVSSRSDCDDMA